MKYFYTSGKLGWLHIAVIPRKHLNRKRKCAIVVLSASERDFLPKAYVDL